LIFSAYYVSTIFILYCAHLWEECSLNVSNFPEKISSLLISEEQIEAKSKRERERYIQLNAEFQRTARRDKKAFFNEQCLIIEENNKRKKTGDLFRKIGNIEGAFFPKMCTIKDKNGRDIVC